MNGFFNQPGQPQPQLQPSGGQQPGYFPQQPSAPQQAVSAAAMMAATNPFQQAQQAQPMQGVAPTYQQPAPIVWPTNQPQPFQALPQGQAPNGPQQGVQPWSATVSTPGLQQPATQQQTAPQSMPQGGEQANAPQPFSPAIHQPATAPQPHQTPGPLGSQTGTAPQYVQVSSADMERYRAMEAQIQQAEDQRIAAMAQAGQVQEALESLRNSSDTQTRQLRDQLASMERDRMNEIRDRSIMEAFAGRMFAGQTQQDQSTKAMQLATLLQGQFETVRDQGGALVTINKVTRQPASASLQQMLDSPEYSHFFAPRSAAPGMVNPYPTQPQPVVPPQRAPGSVQDVAARIDAVRSQYPAYGFN